MSPAAVVGPGQLDGVPLGAGARSQWVDPEPGSADSSR